MHAAGGSHGCPGVGDMKGCALEVQLLTQLPVQFVHMEWQSGEGMGFRSMPFKSWYLPLSSRGLGGVPKATESVSPLGDLTMSPH